MKNQQEELLGVLREAACEVYSTLRAGYAETVYEEAMAVEFRLRGIAYELQRSTEIFYKDEKVGSHRLDFIVEDSIVVELKAGTALAKSHVEQLRSYMRTVGMPAGILVNFPYPEKEKPDFHNEISL